MEWIEQIITTTIDSFDFTFCISANIATYIIIKVIDELNGKKKVSTWTKRIVLLCVIISLGIAWYICGAEAKLILNSAILAPVFWSWIGKPICAKLNIDYNKNDSE